MTPKYPVGTFILNGNLLGVIVDNTRITEDNDVVYTIRWKENDRDVDATYNHKLLNFFKVLPIGE